MTMQPKRELVNLLWLLISTNYGYQAFRIPEDRAEILEMLSIRLEEEMNKLVPETNALL